MAELMRLQKAMAHKGICSRRKAEEYIASGLVKVNGITINEMGHLVTLDDVIEVEGLETSNVVEEKVSFLFNKPTGVVSTASDDRNRRTVLDFFKNENYRLYPAGRLDLNTSGALIITNDGELSELITHPSSHLDKTYLASLTKKITSEEVFKLEKGIMLEDGLTAPAQVKVLKNDDEKVIVKITIHEGRNRQVRRMFEAISHHVKALHRVSVGFLNVKEIERGTYRKLTELEVLSLKNICKERRKKNIIPDYKQKK